MQGGWPGIRTIAAGVIAVSTMIVSGCAGPTYGTGTPAEAQLLEDVTGVLSLGPRDKPRIDYSPRPNLVKPPSTAVLPPPQEPVAASGNSAWPESPEQRLARIRAEATANQDNPSYSPNIIRDMTGQRRSMPDFVMEPSRQRAMEPTNSAQQRAEILRRRQELTQGSPTTRRYLSDPPVELRQPAPTAPTDELGEDEAAKKRASNQRTGLSRLIPWR